jgi:hypothetical protein
VNVPGLVSLSLREPDPEAERRVRADFVRSSARDRVESKWRVVLHFKDGAEAELPTFRPAIENLMRTVKQQEVDPRRETEPGTRRSRFKRV